MLLYDNNITAFCIERYEEPIDQALLLGVMLPNLFVVPAQQHLTASISWCWVSSELPEPALPPHKLPHWGQWASSRWPLSACHTFDFVLCDIILPHSLRLYYPSPVSSKGGAQLSENLLPLHADCKLTSSKDGNPTCLFISTGSPYPTYPNLTPH